MTANLFVYGTLMPGAQTHLGAPQRARLARESRLLGSAQMQGRLYDLGDYPGAIESADPSMVVHGEVVSLLDPAATWRWLDDYEGIAPGDPDPEYARRLCPVRLSNSDATAWVYLYRWPTHRGRLIAAGRWQPTAEGRPRT